MMVIQNVSEELLNSFVDNQLDPNEKSEMFDAIARDGALKARVCDLRGLKEMVQHAYPPYMRLPIKRLRPVPHYMQSLAACLLLLLLGGTAGWFISAWSGSKSDAKTSSLLQAMQGNDIAREPDKIIVHVSNSNPVRLKTALDETENLLETYKRANRPLRMEIIANRGGVDLLRSDVSPYGARIGLMKAKYPNLDLLACSQTVNNLRKKGIAVHLLPHTGVASSALDEINKRLSQGWDYVRI